MSKLGGKDKETMSPRQFPRGPVIGRMQREDAKKCRLGLAATASLAGSLAIRLTSLGIVGESGPACGSRASGVTRRFSVSNRRNDARKIILVHCLTPISEFAKLSQLSVRR